MKIKEELKFKVWYKFPLASSN